MSFELVDIFPNITQGLSNIGFIFGAGTSLKAGYPLMPELTINVLNRLEREEVQLLDLIVDKSEGKTIDKTNGDPNIEVISDILEAALLSIDSKDPLYTKMIQARSVIREKIVEVLLATTMPDLKDHLRFFNALSRLLSGRPEPVWIFTPNYDLLFELAASMAKVPLHDGFQGTSLRYFNILSLNFLSGSIDGQIFRPFSQPSFRLVKLHGSLDWWKDKSSVYSTQKPEQIQNVADRVMVLPRRKKITETLESPFGDLFRISEKVIGTNCKYLVSCGYGYGDQHINETLLLPKLQQGKIQLTAFVRTDSQNLDAFKKCHPFSYGSETNIRKKNGVVQTGGTDLWQFEKLVDLLCKFAGL